MGIGVSYTGRKGSRQFTLDGAPEAGSEAAGILGDASRRVTEALNRKNPDVIKNYFGGGGDDHTVKATRDDPSPGTLDEKVARLGAIAVDGGKLLLKGEEGGKAVPGNKAYGSIGGNRGYYGLDEIDPPDNPKHIGYVGGGLGEDKTEAKDGEAAKWQQVSHVEVEHDDILGKDILVEYERDVAKSPQGRVVAVSPERRRVLSTILCGGEGEGGGGEVAKPWTFVPGFGWIRPAVQIGCFIYTNPSSFSGLNSTDDGLYYLSVDVSQETLTVTTNPSSLLPCVYIGRVDDGEQVDGIYTMPIIFAYV